MDFDWDAIRIFLAVAEHQSLSSAAGELSLSQPTLGRQITRLEEQLNLRLFERRQTGFFLTDAGVRLTEVAKEMARKAADFKRSVDLQKIHSPDQVCRVTTGEWGQYFLSQHADEIVEGLGGIRLEFYADDTFWDLGRNSADIAIGNRSPKQTYLIAQKLGERGFHVYASREYCDRHANADDPESWQDQIWAGYCGNRARLKSSQLLASILQDHPCKYAVSSSVSLLQLVKNGQAMGILPDWIGDNEDLIRLSKEPLAKNQSWLSFHERLRHHPGLSRVKDRIVGIYRRRYAED
ncbi:LysR family transcriptional regulator [Roseibium sp. SCPC15]|uniref:LysR family transcriptional regulator n=1 Tax=Roseibium sp. SCP15 TaxID=3141376 RepID=UPI003335FCD2